MTAIAYNPLGSGQFTDKILDANFTIISEYTKQLEPLLVTLSKQVLHHEAELAKLSKMRKPHRVLPFVVGAGVGIYVYKRLKKSGLNVEFDAQTGSLHAQKPAETTPKETGENQDFGATPVNIRPEDVHEG
jgi:hypothetical protein